MFECHFSALATSWCSNKKWHAVDAVISSSLGKLRVPASTLGLRVTHSIPHSHWLLQQQTGQFEPRVFLPRYCCWVFEFQVPCYEWVISNSISGELLWVQSPEAEWGWLRQRSTQSLMGPACGGLWDVEAGLHGVQGEHRGGLDVVMCFQRNSLLALLHSEEFEIFASDLKHKVVSHLKEMVYYESLMTCSSLPSSSPTATSGFRYCQTVCSSSILSCSDAFVHAILFSWDIFMCLWTIPSFALKLKTDFATSREVFLVPLLPAPWS